MGTHDDPDRGRTASERAEETVEDKHPARPEQTDESFATGVDRKPDTPEENLEPNFARGLTETDPNQRGSFSTGEEQIPDSPEKDVERRFSEGTERSPTSD